MNISTKCAHNGIDYALFSGQQRHNLSGEWSSRISSARWEVKHSIITEIELLSFSGLSNEEGQRIHDLIPALARVQLTDTVRDLTIQLRRKNRLKLPDAIIAASAMTQLAILLTNDQTFACIGGLNCKALQLK